MNGEPDFIIAGGHKCGTTSLMRTLEQHVDIVRPEVDEPHSLIRKTYSRFDGWNDAASSVQSIEEYSAIHSQSHRTCDGSVLYLSHAAEFMDGYLTLKSQPPVVVLLRDPTRRAWSAYNYARLINPLEDQKSFEMAVKLDGERLADPTVPTVLSYLTMSDYAPALRKLKAELGDRLLVVIFEDLIGDTIAVLERVQRHIGVAPQSMELFHANPGGRWKHEWLRTISNNALARRCVRRGRKLIPRFGELTEKFQSVGTTSVSIDPVFEAELRAYFQPKVADVEAILEQSLSTYWR